jgi:hypothetical protein
MQLGAGFEKGSNVVAAFLGITLARGVAATDFPEWKRT